MAARDSDIAEIAGQAGALLDWYDRNRRDLPWRVPPGAAPDPYRVWLSEVMLQQTTAAVVRGYYARFLARWPTVRALAAAGIDDVLHAWQGLGYYARARNLHRCARAVVAEHGGRFPEDEAALRRLPGIGPYTAAAVAAIAFDRPAAVVDGNVERVVSRLFAVEEPLPGARAELRRLAARLTPARRPGDHAQAMMELGATLCAPRAPSCAGCPWNPVCRGRLAGLARGLPRRAPRPPRPTRYGIVFWTLRGDGAVLLRRRPAEGLLGGMMELPSSQWRGRPWPPGAAAEAAPAPADWRVLPGTVRHVFTHFRLELIVAGARVGSRAHALDGVWAPYERLGAHALPSVMKKVVRHAAAHMPPDGRRA